MTFSTTAWEDSLGGYSADAGVLRKLATAYRVASLHAAGSNNDPGGSWRVLGIYLYLVSREGPFDRREF